jgi:hypothetical protein
MRENASKPTMPQVRWSKFALFARGAVQLRSLFFTSCQHTINWSDSFPAIISQTEYGKK